jgi:hypothetical protein
MTKKPDSPDAVTGAGTGPEPIAGVSARQAFTVRLPGFISNDDVLGLGDAVARAAAGIGFRSCGGCARRAAQLNQWIHFAGRRQG